MKNWEGELKLNSAELFDKVYPKAVNGILISPLSDFIEAIINSLINWIAL